jgi:hypothetical protein
MTDLDAARLAPTSLAGQPSTDTKTVAGNDGGRKPACSIHVLARLRRELWADLDSPSLPIERRYYLSGQVQRLTRLLNGHADDVIDPRRVRGKQAVRSKRGYFSGPSGRWGAIRRERFLARPGGVHPSPDPSSEIDAMMRANRGPGSPDEPFEALLGASGISRGRVRRWTGDRDDGGGFDNAGHLRYTSHWRAGESKRKDLGDPATADLLGASGIKYGHVASKKGLAGGTHDLVHLHYWQFNPKVTLAEHSVALTRRGPLPPAMQKARHDAERIIRGLNGANIPKTEIAHHFSCSRKTVTRICAELVPPFPYGGKGLTKGGGDIPVEIAEAESLPATKADIARLAESLNMIGWQITMIDGGRAWLEAAEADEEDAAS